MAQALSNSTEQTTRIRPRKMLAFRFRILEMIRASASKIPWLPENKRRISFQVFILNVRPGSSFTQILIKPNLINFLCCPRFPRSKTYFLGFSFILHLIIESRKQFFSLCIKVSELIAKAGLKYSVIRNPKIVVFKRYDNFTFFIKSSFLACLYGDDNSPKINFDFVILKRQYWFSRLR